MIKELERTIQMYKVMKAESKTENMKQFYDGAIHAIQSVIRTLKEKNKIK